MVGGKTPEKEDEAELRTVIEEFSKSRGGSPADAREIKLLNAT